jgi:hypothetical protein
MPSISLSLASAHTSTTAPLAAKQQIAKLPIQVPSREHSPLITSILLPLIIGEKLGSQSFSLEGKRQTNCSKACGMIETTEVAAHCFVELLKGGRARSRLSSPVVLITRAAVQHPLLGLKVLVTLSATVPVCTEANDNKIEGKLAKT